jgi:hypothetical protein
LTIPKPPNLLQKERPASSQLPSAKIANRTAPLDAANSCAACTRRKALEECRETRV